MLRKIIYWVFSIAYSLLVAVLSFAYLPNVEGFFFWILAVFLWILVIIVIYSVVKFQSTNEPRYERKILWVMAIVITTSTAIYQRLTGPTYPVDGSAEIGGHSVTYTLPRTHGGEGGPDITLQISDPEVQAVIHHKRYNVDEPFTLQEMVRSGDSLTGTLPHQPPAGKLEYYVELIHEEESEFIPGPQTVVIRFKGAVPGSVLVPHVFLMFLGMLWSNRGGIDILSSKGKTKSLTLWTTIMLAIGGLIFGPIVQKFAFDALWTGVPFGWDLTDNKTLIFVVVWAIALWRHRFNPNPRYFVLMAALITFAMYMIPHSTMGSELDYTTGEVKTG